MERKPRIKKKDMINKRSAAYKIIYEMLADTTKENPMIFVEAEDYHLAFGPWKEAARECGLQYRRGLLFAGNNRFYFPLIYMPQIVEFLPNDAGAWIPSMKKGFWISAHRTVDGKRYKLQTMYWCEESSDCEVVYSWVYNTIEGERKKKGKEQKKGVRCISKAIFEKMLYTYKMKLARRIDINCQAYRYTGWQINMDLNRPIKYWTDQDTCLWESKDDPFYFLRKANRLDSPLSAILFCATLFSVSKQLLNMAKLPTEFVLYLAPYDEGDFQKNYYYRHHWICYYCNPNKCKNIYKDFGRFGFDGFERVEPGYLSPSTHHNFPFLCRKGDPYSKHYTNMGTFTRKEANMLKKATALPILLAPVEDNLKNLKRSDQKPFKGCLTINIPIILSDLLIDKKDAGFRDDLFDFYFGFLNYLNDAPDDRILDAKRLHMKALNELNCDQGTATDQQSQIACLLTAVFLAKEYIYSIQTGVNDYFAFAERVLRSFGKDAKSTRQRVASVTAFADYLKNLMNKSEDQFPLLLQDEHYLYLDFKEYWSAFEDYCHANDILITESHKGFRREHLAKEFLKPQYEPKPGEYPRYDCRKLIGTKKKTVLVVKKTILEYALVRKDPKLN